MLSIEDINQMIALLELPARPIARKLRNDADRIVAAELMRIEESDVKIARAMALRLIAIALPEGSEPLESMKAAAHILGRQLEAHRRAAAETPAASSDLPIADPPIADLPIADLPIADPLLRSRQEVREWERELA